MLCACAASPEGSPVAILPSAAAGPSGMTLFTCRNSSGSSPPMMVKPKPMLLFWSDVDRKLPFSWVGSRVNSGFSAKRRTHGKHTHRVSQRIRSGTRVCFFLQLWNLGSRCRGSIGRVGGAKWEKGDMREKLFFSR